MATGRRRPQADDSGRCGPSRGPGMRSGRRRWRQGRDPGAGPVSDFRCRGTRRPVSGWLRPVCPRVTRDSPWLTCGGETGSEAGVVTSSPCLSLMGGSEIPLVKRASPRAAEILFSWGCLRRVLTPVCVWTDALQLTVRMSLREHSSPRLASSPRPQSPRLRPWPPAHGHSNRLCE